MIFLAEAKFMESGIRGGEKQPAVEIIGTFGKGKYRSMDNTRTGKERENWY